jgi:O-antigen/teichoic acid export membrane protein
MDDLAVQQRHPYLQRIVSNIGWLIFDRAFRLGVGVLVTVAIARHLGPENFGKLNYGMAVFALIGVCASLGLDQVVQRDLVKAPQDRDCFLGTCIGLKTIAGVLGYIFLVVVVGQTVSDRATRLTSFIIGAGLLVNGALFTFDNWFQSQTKAKYGVYAQNAAFIAVTVVRVSLLYLGAGLLAFAWCVSVELLLAAIFSLTLFQIVVGLVTHWKFDLSVARGWLPDSWPLLLSGVAIIVYARIDQVMLAHLASERALGIYSAAVKVSEVGYFVPSILATSFFPSIVRTRELGAEAYNVRRQHYFDLSVVLAVAIALPTTLLAGPIIHLLYGDQYAEAVPILCALVWATLFVFTGGARQQYLVAEGHMKFSFAATLAAAILNVVLNIFLIPRYEGFGAAMATLVSYGLSAIFSSFFYKPTRLMGWELLKSFDLFGAARRLLSYAKRAPLLR